MFDQTFVDTHAQTRKPWTVAASLSLQTILVAILLLAPLFHIATLEPPEKLPVWLSVELPKPPVAQPTKITPHQVSARPIFDAVTLRAPLHVPAHIDMTADVPELASPGSVLGPGEASLSGLSGIAILPPAAPQTPPEKPKPTPQSAAPVRVGSGVQSAKLIFGPKPPYPPLARATRTQGTVKIQALIGRDGTIRNLQVLSGPPLLISAAIEAVQQWRYQPTLLNQQTVEVATEIDVSFTMSQ